MNSAVSTPLELLKFNLISTDGGQTSSAYKCENMLATDSNVYCTKKKENINILLQYSDLTTTFVITHVIVKAPELAFPSTLGEALIFISHDPFDVASTSQFDGFDLHKYRTYLKAKKQKGEGMSDSDPAAYINLRETWCLVHKLAIPRSGKYVLIKLLRSRNHNGENIDVQYIGFKGFVGPQAFPCGDLA